ncbi:MAG: hypothetical protein WDN46_01015 [Methylocella sp.]
MRLNKSNHSKWLGAAAGLAAACIWTGLVAIAPDRVLAQSVQAPPLQAQSHVEGTPPGTVMTKEYVELVGRLAYLWGWPLVNNLNRSLAVAELPEPGRMAMSFQHRRPGRFRC